jgi:hypothetical protein
MHTVDIMGMDTDMATPIVFFEIDTNVLGNIIRIQIEYSVQPIEVLHLGNLQIYPPAHNKVFRKKVEEELYQEIQVLDLHQEIVTLRALLLWNHLKKRKDVVKVGVMEKLVIQIKRAALGLM